MKIKIISASAQINRNFYWNLKDIGRSDEYIMNIIQSNRKIGFYNDISSCFNWSPVDNVSLWRRLINKFKLKKW